VKPRWSAVVLSQGDRPVELNRAIKSLFAQEGVKLEVIVVGNGWAPTDISKKARTLHLDTNLGAPKGRNRGIKKVRGRYVFFLDDDAYLPDTRTLVTLEKMFNKDLTLGVVQTRIQTPEGVSMRRWVPRIRNKDPEYSSEVFAVLEGSLAVRRRVLKQTRGWAGRFFYAHEGIELAWRAWDAGYRVEYCGKLAAVHPRVFPDRHNDHLFLNARNRVWLAKRNLPNLVASLYVFNWAIVTLSRQWRHPSLGLAWLRGVWAGMRGDAGVRRPMSWSTVWIMTRRGRPPII
jgi:GT2 family glycosyltransferase